MFVKILIIVGICLISIIVLIFIVLSVLMLRLFKKTFKRTECKSLLDMDLSNTHYAKHLDKIRINIKELEAKPCEVVKIKNDGLTLSGRFYNQGSSNTVIMAHGYHAKAFNNFHASSQAFFNHNYNILMIDERAHNDSEGRYTTVGIKEQYDIISWIKWVEETTNTNNIILYGVSMGASTLGYLSNKLEDTLVRAIVMDCGFTSFYDEVFYKTKTSALLPFVLFYMRLYAKMVLGIDIRKSTLESLKDAKVPVYFIHGLNDEMVPVEHTIAAFNATTSEKRVHYVEECGHTTAFLIDYDYLDKDLFSFIGKFLR